MKQSKFFATPTILGTVVHAKIVKMKIRREFTRGKAHPRLGCGARNTFRVSKNKSKANMLYWFHLWVRFGEFFGNTLYGGSR
jgi:hypothetical protein